MNKTIHFKNCGHYNSSKDFPIKIQKCIKKKHNTTKIIVSQKKIKIICVSCKIIYTINV